MADPNSKMPMPPALQLFAGIYLIYTAWNLRTDVAERPLFLIAVILFALAGAGLIAFGGWRMCKAKPKPLAPENDREETEE